jgi:hypothetical protein
MTLIARVLSSIEFGRPVQVGNLSMFPILAAGDEPADYLTLDDAIRAGSAKVTEVSEQGSVPALFVKNTGAKPVLIIDGEELIGAKQNRVVNLSILVPAAAALEIPVSCVEAGRWGGRSRHFTTAPRAHYAEARAQKLACVSTSMRDDGSRAANQGAIWADIDAKSRRMGVASATSAMDVMFEAAGTTLEEFESGLQPAERQAGALFAINGVIVGLDLFDRPSTFRKLLPKLVHSYGLDALDRGANRRGARGAGSREAVPDPAKFLHAVAQARAGEFPAIGVGQDLRLEGDGIAGAALAAGTTLVHLVAFAM